MACLSLRLLGPLQITLDEEPVAGFQSEKGKALLAYLAVEADQPHRREALAGLLWPDMPERSARANLRTALTKVRQAIGDRTRSEDRAPSGSGGAQQPLLTVTRQTIQFNRAGDAWVDVTAFTMLLHASRTTDLRAFLPGGEANLGPLEEAVALYGGDFLTGFSLPDSSPFEEWALLTREWLRRLAQEALRRLADIYEQRGEYRRALPYTWRQVDMDPLQEEAHRQVMRLLASSGQRGAALAQYTTCQRLLVEELGVEPAAETTRLYEQIRDGEVGEHPPAPTRMAEGVEPPAFLAADEVSELPGEAPAPVFVARERELAHLDGHLGAALGGGSRVVFVTGGAGRGKTALLEEFARRAVEVRPGLIVASGKCNAYSGFGDPYLPFRDVLSMLTGDVEARWAAGELTQKQAVRLWEGLPRAIQVLVDRGPGLVGIFVSGPDLLSRASMAAPAGADWLQRLTELAERDQTSDSGLQPAHLFEQFANVLRGLAAQQPLLLLLDDLQWADSASISLLFHLGRRMQASPILIVGAFRPDEVALGRDGERHPLEPVLAEFKRLFGDVSLDLAEGAEAEAQRFVDDYLDTEPNRLDARFRQALSQQTAGHPLFTIELLRTMQERGDVERDTEGRWVEGSKLNWHTLPARVEGVIEERLGRLGSELRQTLSLASVEGMQFTAQVMAQVSGAGQRHVLGTLSQELERRHRLVREQGEEQVGQRHVTRFEFTHVLFQQYLYRELGIGERRLLHREIAAALEQLYAEHPEGVAVIAGQLARHYAGDPERERHYAGLAGERAASYYGNDEALTYLGRALDLTPIEDHAGRYALLLARERIYDLQGRREDQERDLTALEEAAAALDDDRLRAEASLRQANYASLTGDYGAAVTAAQEAISFAQTGQAADLEAAVHLQWGQVLWVQGDYDQSQAQLERALTLARASELAGVEAGSLRNLGAVRYYLGDHSGARGYFGEALRLYRRIGNRRSESNALNSLGLVSLYDGEYAEARSCFEQAVDIYRQIGDRRGEDNALRNQGAVAAHLGQYSEAEGYLRQGMRICREIGDRRGEGWALAYLSQIYHQLGQDEAARAFCTQSLAILDQLDASAHRAGAWACMGDALLGLGRLDEAASAYERSRGLRRQLDQEYLAVEPVAGLACVFLRQDNLTEALELVEEILDQMAPATRDAEMPQACERVWQALEGVDEPFWVYLTCYRVLQAASDPRAHGLLLFAHGLLLEHSNRVEDHDLRRSFFENVPAHRDLVRVWEQRGSQA